MKVWSSQFWLRFKQKQLSPKNVFGASTGFEPMASALALQCNYNYNYQRSWHINEVGGHFSLYSPISLVFIQPLPASSTVIKTYCCNSHQVISELWRARESFDCFVFLDSWKLAGRWWPTRKRWREGTKWIRCMSIESFFCFVGLPIEVHPKEIEYCVKGERFLRSNVECLVDTIFLWGSFWRKVAVTKNAFSKYNCALLLSISRFDITPFKTHKVLHNWTGTEVFDRI